jgi:UPF0716 protein FxsA
MLSRLVLIAGLALPLIEIALFIVIGRAIGVLPTLLGVVLGAIAGGLVIRWQGLAALRNMQAAVQRGELPARQIGDAMLIGLGGLLLAIPGYLSDLVGIGLLLPPVRALLWRLLSRHLRVVGPAGPAAADPTLIELDQTDWRDR